MVDVEVEVEIGVEAVTLSVLEQANAELAKAPSTKKLAVAIAKSDFIEFLQDCRSKLPQADQQWKLVVALTKQMNRSRR